MNIKRITDKNSDDLFKFRMAAIEECGGAAKHVMMQSNYKNITRILKDYGATRIEDIYRFTESKWSTTQFDFIDAHYSDNGDITNISGALQYNNWLRIGIYHFGLKKYSSMYPSVLFQPNGHLDRALDYCKNKNLDGIFISVFPHNNKLKAFSKALKKKTGISTQADINLIRKLKFKGSFVLNDVEQDFFVVELGKEFSITDIL